ncbi:MAG: prepilin peptidase [Ignavibacteriales bacterium]|nr:prepilin peptidase [Ignavibacteriales bacterium]
MIVAAALVSLIFGSFANNVISHFSFKSKFDLVRSYCMCGDKMLKAAELIPFFNFIYQRGKCSYCHRNISLRYPIIEMIVLTMGLIFFIEYNLSVLFILFFAANCLLLCIAVIDYYSYKIPNLLVIILLFISVMKAALFNTEFLLNVIISLSIGVLFILLNNLFDIITNKNVIGYGDIKLMAVINLFFGYQLFFLGLWFSALISIPGFYLIKSISKAHSGETRIPFGFFLGIGFILTSVFDEKILPLFYTIIGV